MISAKLESTRFQDSFVNKSLFDDDYYVEEQTENTVPYNLRSQVYSDPVLDDVMYFIEKVSLTVKD